jgi:hypothetical protein
MSLRTAFFIVWLVVMVYTVYNYFWRPSEKDRQDYQTRRQQLGEEHAIAMFQGRRRRCLWFGAVPMAVAVGTWALVFFAATGRVGGTIPWETLYAVRFVGLDGITLVFTAFFLFGGAIVFVTLTYRCPVCGQLPGSASGVPVNPQECPTCGTRLAPRARGTVAVRRG